MSKMGRLLIAMMLMALLSLFTALGCAEGVLTLPANVKVIADEAFAGAQSFSEIVLPEGVQTIGSRAFADSAIERINLPDSVTSIGQDAFSGCDALRIYGNEGSYAQTYAQENGIPFISAQEADYVYSIVEGGAVITGYTGAETDIVIPETLGGYPVTALDRPAFEENTAITSIVFPASLERIGGYVFWGCKNLASVTFNSQVTQIGEFAFFQCRVLEDFMLPESVKTIGDSAFAGCHALTKLPFGGHVETIGSRAFAESWGMTEVEIPAGVVSIGESAFADSQYLTKVTIPDSVTSIGTGAFDSCHRDLTLYGYEGSYAQTYASQNGIPFVALDGSEETSEFTYVVSEMGTLINGYTGSSTAIVIPASIGAAKIDGVWYGAFQNNTTLTSVTLSEGLTMICGNAFSGCTALESVTIPDSMLTIGSSAFSGCTALKEIDLPANTTLNWGAFYGCSSLERVTLPANLTAIPDYAFRECELLISAPIPAGVTQIGEYAFFECINLRDVELPAGLVTLGEYAFDNCEMIEMITLPATLETLGRYAFYSCASLTSVAFNSDITEIGEFTFFQCANLEDIQLPASVTSIGTSAFVGCHALTALPFGEGVESIGERAFSDSRGFIEIEIPTSVKEIGANAFSYCYNLTKATIPATVTAIGANAFNGCEETFTLYGYTGSAAQTYASQNGIPFVALDGESTPDEPETADYTYTIENGEVTITEYTGSETDVVIPSQIEGYPVKNIGAMAFFANETVTSVVIPDGVVTLDRQCFNYCTSLVEMTIPASVTTFVDAVFRRCNADLMITGARDSAAQEYALAYGVGFKDAATGEVLFDNDYGYTIANGEVKLNAYTGSETEVRIPAEIEGYPVTEMGGGMLIQNDEMIRLVIPSSVSMINGGVAQYCMNLEEIEFAQGLKTIYDASFRGCEKLTSIVLPEGLTTINTRVFKDCTALASVTIPASVTQIGAESFTGCSTDLVIYGYTGSYAQTYADENGIAFVALDGESTPDEPEVADYTYTIENGEVTITDYTGSETGTLRIPSVLGGYPVTTIERSAFANCSASRIIIPQSVQTLAVSSFTWCTSLTSVVIPETVTQIGANAFQNCSVSLVIEGEQDSAAEEHARMYAVGFMDASTGDLLFDDDWGYALDNGEATITAYTAHEEAPTMPTEMDGYPVTAIGTNVMWNNIWVETLTVPQGITKIGATFLTYCSNLTEVTLPDGLTSIGAYSLSGCQNLTSITIPASVTSIGTGVFGNAAEGFTIYGYTGSYAQTYADENGIAFVALDGESTPDEPDEPLPEDDYAYTVENGAATITAYTGSETNFSIPDTLDGYPVAAIGARAFEGNTAIEAVLIPEGVTAIGEYAFAGCTALYEPTLPVSLQSIGAHAFDGCSKLNFVEFEKNVTFVGEDAFANCGQGLFFRAYPGTAPADYADANGIFWEYNYDEYFDGDYVYNVIGDEAAVVSYNGAASELVIPATLGGYPVTMIAPEAFQGMGDLTSVVFPEGLTLIATNAFANCTNLASVSFPSTLREFYGSAFANTALTEITLPESVTSIGFYAFEGCEQLAKVTILSRDAEFAGLVFSGCSADLVIFGYAGSTAEAHAAAQGIAFEALLEYTYALSSFEVVITGYTGTDTELVLPSEIEGYPVTTIGNSAFENRTELTSVTLPQTLTRINVSAFAGCTGLTEITIPGSVTEICDSAFYGCTGLTEITIPESVTTLGGFVFSGCTGLTKAVIPGSVTTFGERVFLDTPAAFEIYGYAGSAAETYAAENGHTFVALDAGPEIEETPASSFAYTVADGEVTIASFTGSETEIVIPKTIEGYPVVTVNSGAFYGKTGVTSVVFQEGVEEIGEYCFSLCTGLTSVTIPSTVEAIGANILNGCSATMVGVENSYAHLYAQRWNIAFTANGSLPARTSEYYYAVNGTECTVLFYTGSVENLVIPEAIDGYTVTGIGAYAFTDVDGLTSSVALPSTLKTIGKHAFSYTSLQEVVIPDGVTSIDSNAFRECYSLNAVTIPASVTSISANAFRDCGESFAIYGYMGSYAQTYAGANGYAFVALDAEPASEYTYTISGFEVTITGYTGTDTELVLPSELEGYPVTMIGNYAFENRTELTSVTLPATLERFNTGAFSGCTGLTELTIPSSVTEIGDSAFYGCTGLTEITIPDSVQFIGNYAFASCTSLTKATIPASVASIGTRAFDSCAAAFEIHGYTGSAAATYASENGHTFVALDAEPEIEETPASSFTYTVADNAVTIDSFTGSEADVVIPASIEGYPVTAIGTGAFSGNEAITSVVVQAGVTEIGISAFNSCTNLKTVSLPDGLRILESNAFGYCSALTEIVVPEGVEYIGSYAFADADALERVTLPASVTTIGEKAFINSENVTVYGVENSCAHLYATKYELPFVATGTQEALDSRFYYVIENGECTITLYVDNEETLVVPAELGGYPVTTIGQYAFGDCDVLTSIELPDTVRTIEDKAFVESTKLAQIVLPQGLERIGSRAFEDCAFVSLTIPNTANYISNLAFYGCDSLRTLVFEDGLTTLGEGAFAFCSALESVTIPASMTSIGDGAFIGCSEAMTIYGYTGSYAETYAAENGYAFSALDAAQETPATSFRYYVEDEAVTILGFTGEETDIVIPKEIEEKPVTGVLSLYGSSAEIKSVVFQEGVRLIGEYCFSECATLESVTIPATLESIGANIMNGCPKASIVGAENSYAHLYAQRWNIPFTANGSLPARTSEYYITTDGTEATVLFYSGSMDNLTIPDVIDGYTVTEIGRNAFTGVSGLTKVTLPSTLKVIGIDAFSFTDLTEIEIPDGVTEICGSAFSECRSLVKATIPASVESISYNAFMDGSESLTIYGYTGSAAETYAQENGYAFVALDADYTYTVENGEATITKYNASETDVVIPASIDGYPVAAIGASAFSGNSLTSVTIPEGVKTIGDQAFFTCRSLSSVTFPTTLESIGELAFVGCDLQIINVPSGVIGEAAFGENTNLAEVEFGEGVTAIGGYAFENCFALTKATIPANVTSIGTGVFGGCSNLVIYGYTGSAAETYAQENGATFVALDTPTVPVVQFATTQVAAAENLAFELFVNAENWTTSAPLTISMTTTDANLDIINTKFTSASQTLMQLGQSGAIYETASSYSNTTAVPNSTSRTFYIQAGASSTPLYIAGNYKKGNTVGRSVTLTLAAPADKTYKVGANSSCTIIYNDVDASMPTDRSVTKAQWMAASKTWLEAKYPSGRNWNHLIGAVNAVDNLTAGACHDDIHVSGTHAIRSTSWDDGAYNITLGARICNSYTPWPSAQCMGFALKAASDVFGSDPKTGSGWTTYASYSAAGGLQAGDYVRVPNHSFFVLSVDASGVSTVECNASDLGKCIIFRKTRPNSATQGEGTIQEICRYNW